MSTSPDLAAIQTTSHIQAESKQTGSTKNQQHFAALIQQKQTAINVSNHAQKRLTDRELSLQEDDYQSIATALTELEEKGSKESLLVYKDMGLIADVHSRTIITAMGMNELHTVTNIDSATFIK
ncbi:flagellar protein [Enterococcus sp.]|uniref:flagellar protein n=1 Tax=Enterococcus sp. TaxID=35783 RepID=UPI0028A2B201|nr:flagellar protein [Enterococcus sp.]